MRTATLIGEGSTDRLLVHPIRWLLADRGMDVSVRWADLSVAPRRPQGLRARLQTAIRLYPCDLLLVHRDSDDADAEPRHAEIRAANDSGVQHVAVVPVRMQEAWLLISETALRSAAGCPRGRATIDLPRPAQLERIADPKAHLRQQLRVASERRGRRLKDFDDAVAIYRLADLIDDWGPLRQLSAFRRLEADLAAALGTT